LLLNAVEDLHCDTNRAQAECASGVPNSSYLVTSKLSLALEEGRESLSALQEEFGI
jgi:hypothetical protein